MSDLAAVYHWPPAATDDIDWLELLVYRADLARVVRSMKGA